MYSSSVYHSPTHTKPVRPKLRVNRPGDRYEQEADAMANRFMDNSAVADQHAASLSSVIGRTIQRKCAHCEEEEKKEKLFRKERPTGTTSSSSSSFDDMLDSSAGHGQPMSAGTRREMEQFFQSDFSQVRIHSNANADSLNREAGALAFAYGNDIYFKQGEYADNSYAGRKLLAHELTHVVQQSNAITPQIQCKDDNKKKDRSDLSKAVKDLLLFDKLPKAAQDKILDEIDKAPETMTKFLFDKIIDSVAPKEYREGLKKAGEVLVAKIFHQTPPSFSICDAIPGFHEGTSSAYKGQCCQGVIESDQNCCPKDRFAPNEVRPCCPPGQVVGANRKCFKPEPVDPATICVPPGEKDKTGKCCMPPLKVINGLCQQRPAPPTPTPVTPPSFHFTVGVIDGYGIGKSVIPSKEQKHFKSISSQIHDYMTFCPASFVLVTGYTDKPGSASGNQQLGLRRADYVKSQLAIDLADIHFGSLPATIFSLSEGENNPVEDTPENVYSAKNRRVEIDFQSICPPLGSPIPEARPSTPLFRSTPVFDENKFGGLFQAF
ncbi:MAG TPA: DUF4157 domain-containing protein [Balneolales bacterium]|nr:DUF4157 domain-containing protein [Balneolales bacterium]